MKIVFHGGNAANFRTGIEDGLGSGYQILSLPDDLAEAADRAHFETADVIVGVRLTSAHPEPGLVRLYQAPAAGTDGIDRSRLPAGAALCNAFGHEHAIAEYVMAALLARHVPLARADQRLREGHWDYWAGREGALRTELGDQTIGLLGYGHIGKAIADRARAFGMKITVCNRSPLATGEAVDATFGLGRIESFMASADHIVVSLPLLGETRGIVNAAALRAMRPHGVIVNVGRGPVIDEQALFDALKANLIGGAIIDTWYQYPTADTLAISPSQFDFASLSNVVMTPHMSGWTQGTVRRRRDTIVENIRRLADGRPLINAVP